MKLSNLILLFPVIDISLMVRALFIYLLNFPFTNRKKQNCIRYLPGVELF